MPEQLHQHLDQKEQVRMEFSDQTRFKQIPNLTQLSKPFIWMQKQG